MKFFFIKTHNIVKTTLLLWVISGCFSIHAQEFLTGIGINTQIIKENQLQKKERAVPRSCFLPFFEDFSNYTGFPNRNLFVDKQAFVNKTFPVRPPTIGVVTLDAVDEYGRIYSHLNEVSKGADTLTSRFIRLDSLWVADTLRAMSLDKDSLYFSFYFQPGGARIQVGDVGGHIGSQPNINDSLVLEFRYAYKEKDTLKTGWKHIWSTPGFSVDTWISENPHQYFKQIMIPITDTIYGHDTFQFRFRNYASLEPQQGIAGWEGNVDQWHIDYIRLDVNRSIEDTTTNDLAFVTPTTSFLKNYQSMPWKHFHEDDMKKNFTNELTNLSDGHRTPRYRYYITQSGKPDPVHEYKQQWGGADDIKPYSTNGLYQNNPVTNPEIKFVPQMKDTASFVITHIFTNNSEDDFCVSNDTCLFEQKFYNYYAYDDGTAEYGYCLNNQYNIAKLAMKFSLLVPDSLSAVRMWFNHTKNSENEAATFSIMVWEDKNGAPGDTLRTMKGQTPQFADSLHYLDFVEYRFDEKFFIKEAHKNFWIGFEQHGNVQLNIGFDQNNDSREFFKYNTNGTWRTSSYRGTPMLRPVFGEPYSVSVPTPKFATIKIYPNPTTGDLNLIQEKVENGKWGFIREIIENVEIFDIFGKKLQTTPLTNTSTCYLNISHLKTGVYFLKVKTSSGVFYEKIIKY